MKNSFKLLLILMGVSCTAWAEDSVNSRGDLRLDSPAGGWNVFGLVDNSSEQAALILPHRLIAGARKIAR